MGCPRRKLINRTFLAGAIAAGMDAAIIDPTDPQLMAVLLGAEAVFGRDEYCMNLIERLSVGQAALSRPRTALRVPISPMAKPGQPSVPAAVTFLPESAPGRRAAPASACSSPRGRPASESSRSAAAAASAAAAWSKSKAARPPRLTEITAEERALLPPGRQGKRYRLACMAHVRGDVRVSVPPESQRAEERAAQTLYRYPRGTRARRSARAARRRRCLRRTAAAAGRAHRCRARPRRREVPHSAARRARGLFAANRASTRRRRSPPRFAGTRLTGLRRARAPRAVRPRRRHRHDVGGRCSCATLAAARSSACAPRAIRRQPTARTSSRA